MKNLLQNLLIFFALALCILIALQWHRESRMRQATLDQAATIRELRGNIDSLQAAVKNAEAELSRLDVLKKHFAATVQTNESEIARLKTDLQRRDTEFEQLDKQVKAYEAALQTANENIKKQNESIAIQNEAAEKLATERNEAVLKFNQLTETYNDLVRKWNALQEQLAPKAGNN